MTDLTAAEIDAQNKATAAQFNMQGASQDDPEAAARAAAMELGKANGNLNHDGQQEVHQDTPEEAAATAAAKVKAEAEAAIKAAQDAEDKKTPEEKAADAEAKAKADAEAADKKAEDAKNAEWMTTDSKEFNASIDLMRKSGMTPGETSEIFDAAINSNDLSKIDRATLVEKIGEDKAALVIAGFTQWSGQEGAAVLEQAKAIHDTVGGPENFAEMVTWARAKAQGDEAFTKEINDLTEMMNGNPTQGKLAATEFQRMYNADATNTTLGAAKSVDILVPNKAAPAVTPATPINARQYAEGVQKAQKMNGVARVAAERELSRNRAAGRASGL